MDNSRFFGLHFDFHAGNDYEIGANTTIEGIENFLLKAKPNFIQCDCKGHGGLACFPTKVGTPAKKLVKDNLRVWADACKKHNIPLYVHYSGVADKSYVKNHPNEAQVNEDGSVDGRMSLFGNYCETLLVPQLKELIDEYNIAGVWVDGDCWAVRRDYSDLAKPYLHENITKEEHDQIMRQAFFDYVKKYTDELHAYNPNFKVISNWLYSSYVPGKPEINVDYISGDILPNDSTHNARYEARCVANRGITWDLMSWSFEKTHFVDKSSVQLMQEAAVIMSLGGGFQIYFPQLKDGSARVVNTDYLISLSDFVKDRFILYRKPSIAQVGVFYSENSYYKKANVFNAAGATVPVMGILHGILDAQFTANVIMEFEKDNFAKYPVLAVPEWEDITDEMQNNLINYAKNGGKLVVCGIKNTQDFASKLSVKTGGIINNNRIFLKDNTDKFTAINNWVEGEIASFVDLLDGSGGLYDLCDNKHKIAPSYKTVCTQKGSVTFIPFDLGPLYYSYRSFQLVNFISEVVSSLITPLVTLNKRNIDVTIQDGGDFVYLNVINMNQGRHSLGVLVYDDIPVINDVEITINKPCKKVISPLNEEFTVKTDNKKTVISIKKLDIHSIFELTF